MELQVKEIIETTCIFSLSWGIWGAIHYLDQIRKGKEKFNIFFLIIDIMIAWWIANILWPFVPIFYLYLIKSIYASLWVNGIIQEQLSLSLSLQVAIASVWWFFAYPLLKKGTFIINKYDKNNK